MVHMLNILDSVSQLLCFRNTYSSSSFFFASFFKTSNCPALLSELFETSFCLKIIDSSSSILSEWLRQILKQTSSVQPPQEFISMAQKLSFAKLLPTQFSSLIPPSLRRITSSEQQLMKRVTPSIK